MVRRSGNYIQDSFPGTVSDRAGALSVGRVFSQPGETVVGESGVLRPERSELEPLRRRELDQRGYEDADGLLKRAGLGPRSPERFYRLEEGTTYVVEFAESPTVPDGGVGILEPSENLRSANVIMTASFVGPDHGPIEASLKVDDQFALVAEDAAIAELIVVPTAEKN